MRIGFFPLLLGTLIVGAAAGGAAAYATTPARPAPAVSPAPASESGAPTTQDGAAPTAGQRRAPVGVGGGQAGGAPGAQPAGGAPGGQASGGDPTQGANRALTGAVTRIEGNQIVLTTPQGEATVRVGEGTTVQRSVPASLADLKAGDRLLVTTRQGPDGALTAIGVQIVGGN
jgi:hypothetical protein